MLFANSYEKQTGQRARVYKANLTEDKILQIDCYLNFLLKDEEIWTITFQGKEQSRTIFNK